MVIWKHDEVKVTPILRDFIARLFGCLPSFRTLSAVSIRSECAHQAGPFDEMTALIEKHGTFQVRREDFV